MNEQKRRDWIISEIKKNGQVLVSDITKILNVSAVTIRTDFNHLEKIGLISRFHGGATFPTENKILHPILMEENKNKNKEKIAECAIKLVKNNSTIVIGSGTTTAVFAEKLAKSNIQELTVITNNILAIPYLATNKNIYLVVIGGKYQRNSSSTFSESLDHVLKTFKIDQLFTGADGFNNEFTMTKNDGASMSATLSEYAKETYVLAESYKKNKQFFTKVLNKSQINKIITEKTKNI